jgi:hypothetical protein
VPSLADAHEVPLPSESVSAPDWVVPKTYWMSPFCRRQYLLLQLILLPWGLGVAVFIAWWFNPAHHINVVGSLIDTAICFC